MSVKAYMIDSNLAQYTAEEISFISSLITSEGIFDINTDGTDFKVTESSPAAMTVDIDTGAVCIEFTKNGVTWKVVARNNASASKNISSNSSGSNRVDAVVVHITEDEPDALKTNVAEILVVTGTGVSALSDAAVDAAVGDQNWYRLANVTVSSGATSIVNANIADTRSRVTLDALPTDANDTYVTKTTDQTTGLDGDKTWTGRHIFADDEARSSTNAAPVDEKSFANKKYVDDQVDVNVNQAQTYVAGEAIDGSVTPQAMCIAGNGYRKTLFIHENGASGSYPFQEGITWELSGTPANLSYGNGDTTTKRAQGFTYVDDGAVTVKVKAVTIWVQKAGNPTDNLLVEIFNTSAGLPTTVVTNGTSNSIAYNTYDLASWTPLRFTFATSPTITAGALHAVAMKRSGVNDAANYYKVYYEGADNYASHSRYSYTASTLTWTNDSTQDIMMMIEFEVDYNNRAFKFNPTDMSKCHFAGFTYDNISLGADVTVIPPGKMITGFPAASFTQGDTLFAGTTFGGNHKGVISSNPDMIKGQCFAPLGQAMSTTALFGMLVEKIVPMKLIQSMTITGDGSGTRDLYMTVACGIKPHRIEAHWLESSDTAYGDKDAMISALWLGYSESYLNFGGPVIGVNTTVDASWATQASNAPSDPMDVYRTERFANAFTLKFTAEVGNRLSEMYLKIFGY